MTECGRIAHRASRIASSPLLQITDLAVSFDLAGGGRARAVDGVSLTIYPRQTLALVGESGCGKSVTALCALGLGPQPPGRVERGRIVLEGRDLLALNARQMREVRGRRIAMIFQEPMTSLNPVYTVGDQLLVAIRWHRKVDRRGAAEAAVEAMTDVGI
ncbi:MAG: ATP-binding cassette domain-containing protein, partial [Proteobacteria bacterium]|nr:ATP-binding cassette domain-containing protein [Pseudomonadota bacterium]